FHRIIPGFMIQTGSPNGDGVGGAGYSYESEKNRAHDKAGLLSTANTGAFPPSNGSGFFITVAPATHLDGASSAHSVFGDIIEGLDVLQALGNVPTDCTSGSACFVSVDCNDRPCDPPVIHSITIERCGAAALAFDVHAQGLPDVFSQAPTLDLSAVKTITFPLVDNTGYYLQASSNLTDWATAFLGFYSNTPPEQVFDLQQFIPPDSPYGFFSLAAVTYPAVFTPRVMEQFSFNATDGFFSFQLDDADSGSVLSGTEPRLVGNMTSWSWTQDPYQGTLLFFYEGDVTPRAVQIRMLFTDRSYSAGVFELGSGGYFSLGTVSGNFTFSFTP
ncbi:MAG: cyclophilin family peptidyl-prolyl cis-trans isomerase, partial [Verrucomicrobiales bacterium]